MIELLVLGGLIAAGLAVAAVVGFVLFVLRMVFWLVLLPFRLLLLPIRLVFFPFRLLRKLVLFPLWLGLGGIGLAVGTIAVPLLLVGILAAAVVGVIAAVLAFVLPAIPFLLLGLLLWAVFRRSPAVA